MNWGFYAVSAIVIYYFISKFLKLKEADREKAMAWAKEIVEIVIKRNSNKKFKKFK